MAKEPILVFIGNDATDCNVSKFSTLDEKMRLKIFFSECQYANPVINWDFEKMQ